jgi:hypothetical protein
MSSMVEEDAGVRGGEGLDVAGRSPQPGIAPGSEVHYEGRSVAVNLVLEVDTVWSRQEGHRLRR